MAQKPCFQIQNGTVDENLPETQISSNHLEKHLETIKKSLRPTTNNKSNNLESKSKSKLKVLPWMKNLNLSFPHVFREEINWELVDTLAEETSSWAERVFQSSTTTAMASGSESKECYNFFSDFKSKARDIMIMPILCALETWDENTEAGFAKHLLWAKMFASLFIHDDMMEAQIGKAGFFKFIQVNAQVLYKIFSLQHGNIEQVIEDILNGLKGSNPDEDFAQLLPTIIIWYDISVDLQRNYGVTKDQMLPLAKAKRGDTLYMAWCGQEDQKFMDNISLRQNCRENTIQNNTVMEFLFLLEGCSPRAALREDIHFLRFQRLSCEIVAMVNDLLSAAKELATESYPDNLVALYMSKSGMSLSESYLKVVQKHNEKVSEFQQLYAYIRSDAFSPLDAINGTDSPAENGKKTIAPAPAPAPDSTVVDLYALNVGSFFQSHYMMERYRRYFTENLE